MGRGAQAAAVPAATTALPQVSFDVVEDYNDKPHGVHNLVYARRYGYNPENPQDFVRPDHYIRYIEPLDYELERQVEYDMDEQDKSWLDLVNAERTKSGCAPVSCEVFEVIMDRLEKDWFKLTKSLPKSEFAMPSEDSTCAVCDDPEGENSNAIVFCDGCNLAVHQDCYGIPYIPEGQWLCRKCTVSPENPVSCVLCPNEGGAFKQTNQGTWAHLLCAIWIPETCALNTTFMEPIIGIELIQKPRWKLQCQLCKKKGPCIQCNQKTCAIAFHATCARKEKLLLPMKSASDNGRLEAYCEKHLPKEYGETRLAALEAEEANEEEDVNQSKSARAYDKTYKPPPPLVPAWLSDRVLKYIEAEKMSKKADFVYQVCRYWSLKREARRGAPLLKRLHLEPWTANTVGKVQTEEEKQMKYDQLQRLRNDLFKIRELAALTLQREELKREQVRVVRRVLDSMLFAREVELHRAFKEIIEQDRNGHFTDPVNKNDVPDYYDVIEKPMCWSMMEERFQRHEYWDIQPLEDDVRLVLANAKKYNKPSTIFFRAALRIEDKAGPVFKRLRAEFPNPSLPPPPQPVPSPTPQSDETSVPPDAMEVDKVSTSPPLPPLEEDHKNENASLFSPPPEAPLFSPPPEVPSPHPPPEADHNNENAPPVSPPPWTPLPLGDLEPRLDIVNLLVDMDAIKNDIPIELHEDPFSSLLKFELPVERYMTPPPVPEPPPVTDAAPKKKTKKQRERERREREEEQKERRRLKKAEERERIREQKEKEKELLQEEKEREREQKEREKEQKEQQRLLNNEKRRLARKAAREAAAAERPPTPPPPVISVKPGEIPTVTDALDPRSSFMLFETGWILPPGEKRGGRKPPPPVPHVLTGSGSSSSAPLPKKKSSKPTEASANVPPPRSISLSVSGSSSSKSKSVSTTQQIVPRDEDVDPMALQLSAYGTRRQTRLEVVATGAGPSEHPTNHDEEGFTIAPNGEKSRIIREHDGQVVLEELDTPATRRAKARRLRQSRTSAARASVTTSSAAEAEQHLLERGEQTDDDGIAADEQMDIDVVGEPSVSVPHSLSGGDQEESELSEAEDEEPSEGVGDPQTVPLKRKRTPNGPETDASPADTSIQPTKKPRGRPKGSTKKHKTMVIKSASGEVPPPPPPPPLEIVDSEPGPSVRRGRGRPRKYPLPQTELPTSVPAGQEAQESELSDVPDERPQAGPSERRSISRGAPRKKRRGPSHKAIPRGPEYERLIAKGKLKPSQVIDSTTVWAKIGSWPWFPAEIFSPDGPEETRQAIPNDVVRKHKQAVKRHPEEKVYLVKFFDGTGSWGYPRLKDMLNLGGVPELDNDLKSKDSIIQRWKGQEEVKQVEKAFEKVCEAMPEYGPDDDDDDAEAEAEDEDEAKDKDRDEGSATEHERVSKGEDEVPVSDELSELDEDVDQSEGG